MILPATAPTMISIRATEIAAQIDITDAARARPIHKADANQILSIPNLFPCPAAASGGAGQSGPWSRDSLAEERFAGASTDLPPLLNGRSHQPHRRFWGTPSPFSTR